MKHIKKYWWVYILGLVILYFILFKAKFNGRTIMHGGGMAGIGGGFVGRGGVSSITAFQARPFGGATSSYIGCKIVDCGSGPCNCCDAVCPCNCDGTKRQPYF